MCLFLYCQLLFHRLSYPLIPWISDVPETPPKYWSKFNFWYHRRCSSAKEVTLSLHLFVLSLSVKLLNRFSQNSAEKWPRNNRLDSGGNSNHVMFGLQLTFHVKVTSYRAEKCVTVKWGPSHTPQHWVFLPGVCLIVVKRGVRPWRSYRLYWGCWALTELQDLLSTLLNCAAFKAPLIIDSDMQSGWNFVAPSSQRFVDLD